MKSWRPDEALDVYMMREATTGQHISCTCKMGPASDPMAVVDQYGKIHGMENIRVVDASIMPNCIRRQHQRNHHDHRRASGGVHQGRAVGGANG